MDRGDAGRWPDESGGDGGASKDSRPSIADRRAFYWSGPGWVMAYEEARRLMKAGTGLREAAAAVGWSETDLRAAIARKGRPPSPADVEAAVTLHERPRRTVKQRVEGLKDVSQKTLKLARRYYEVENMTVREVARALCEPYERTYLLLIKANTRFRRPGRRSVEKSDRTQLGKRKGKAR